MAESHPLIALIARIASSQYGVISRRQLLKAGMPSATIAHWVQAGHLHQLHRGVYAVGHRRITREGRWMAAVLACGAGSVLSHGASGQLAGLIQRRERIALHVSIPRGRGANPPGIVVHRPRALDIRDVTTRHGIPTTTPTRTVWDLATTDSSLRVRRAFEQAERLAILDRSRLQQLANAAPNRRGSGAIRRLLAERPLPLAETRSWLEDVLLRICSDHGLPLPLVNVPVLDHEVDFLWPAARFVVEVDGGTHVGAQRDRDNARDVALARGGYLVRRYGYAALADEGAVAAEVSGIVRERS